MSIGNLPSFVRNSTVFSDEDKVKLASLSPLPTEVEVDKFRVDASIQELMNAFIGDESTRDIHLQERAKVYLQHNDILSAWKVILL
ncbi:MAG: hypothetical protein ACI35V_10955 [Sphingobacterium composti]|uniref:hypothetical protein n=1 Tax=Sphingobacterium composti TaxID=363260 RepID=UPI001359290E|nr:hypothetical protein [Sphingobacterium composti Ten et al. 2007 non Yoo et al. 2007]